MTEDWTNLSPIEMVKKLNEIPESPKKTIDETQYPLTFKEFTEKFTNKIIENCSKQYNITVEEVKNDFGQYLTENPTSLYDDYTDCCEYYDLCKEHYGKQKRADGEPIVSPKIAFNARLNLNVHQTGNELYFF